jgi:hypothetical protein
MEKPCSRALEKSQYYLWRSTLFPTKSFYRSNVWQYDVLRVHTRKKIIMTASAFLYSLNYYYRQDTCNAGSAIGNRILHLLLLSKADVQRLGRWALVDAGSLSRTPSVF